VEYVLLAALDLVLDNYKKLKEGEISQECSGVFETTMGLPCAHTCEKRQAQGKPLLLASFHKRWRYSSRTMLNEGIDVPYELTRNPAIIPRKRRKGSRQAILSTRRDPSHWELPGRGRGKGRGRGSVTHRGSNVRGRGRGRGTSRGRGTHGGAHGGRGNESEAPIELSDVGSISSDPPEFEVYIQAAREKRMRMPSQKERDNEAQRAEAEAEAAAEAARAKERAEDDALWGFE
jgi:hypothetical protein